MAKSIGSLYVDIIARTEQLEKDMAKAKMAIGGVATATDGVTNSSKKAMENFKLWNSFMGRGMTGITADMMALGLAVRMVGNEFQFVYNNLEKIPTLTAESKQNINEFKVALKDVRNEADKWIASLMSFGIQWGKMIGTTIGEMVYGSQDMTTQLDTIDKIKAAEDPAYWDKVREAKFKLSEMEKQTAASMLTQAARIEELNKQYELYTTRSTAAARAGDTMLAIQMKSEAHERRSEGMRIASDMTRRVKAFSRQEQVEDERLLMSEMSMRDRMLKLKELTEHYYALVHTRIGAPTTKDVDVLGLGPRSPKEIEQLLRDYPKLITYSNEFRHLTENLQSPIQAFSNVFVSGIGDMNTALTQFVTGAENDFDKLLKNLTDNILNTFFSLALINPLLNAMFGGVKGMAMLPALFGIPKAASGGPRSGWTMVGEEGAELVRLPGGSSVLPAHETRNRLGGGGGNVYQIDARGADPSVIDRVSAALFQLAGPGVVEARAFAAVKDAEWRRNG